MSEIKATVESYGLSEKKIPDPHIFPTFGEILTSSIDTKGALESID